MFIFICDAISDRSFVKKQLYRFYSDVLSNLNCDDMTPKEIDIELKRREIANICENGEMLLIFKKV